MVWLYRGGGGHFTRSNNFYLPSRRLAEEGGGGSQYPVVQILNWDREKSSGQIHLFSVQHLTSQSHDRTSGQRQLKLSFFRIILLKTSLIMQRMQL
jgi:hypothetical protein